MSWLSTMFTFFALLFLISAFFITPAKTLTLVKNTTKASFELFKTIWTDGRPVVGDVIKVFSNETGEKWD